MQQHGGGDRAEYIQETEHNDPWFYVPPVNEVDFESAINNDTSAAVATNTDMN